ncbi:MAG: hypothetical protein AAGG81_02470, partial [Chlamydiota bacterium]
SHHIQRLKNLFLENPFENCNLTKKEWITNTLSIYQDSLNLSPKLDLEDNEFLNRVMHDFDEVFAKLSPEDMTCAFYAQQGYSKAHLVLFEVCRQLKSAPEWSKQFEISDFLNDFPCWIHHEYENFLVRLRGHARGRAFSIPEGNNTKHAVK